MKVKLLQSFAGSEFTHNVGDVIEVSQASAVRLIEDNCAVPFIEEAAVETATEERREKAVVITRRVGRVAPVIQR